MFLTRLLLSLAAPQLEVCLEEGLSPDCEARVERVERKTSALQAQQRLVSSLTLGGHHQQASGQADLLMELPGADVWSLSTAADAWYAAEQWDKAAPAYDAVGQELAWHETFWEQACARAVISWAHLDEPEAYEAAITRLAAGPTNAQRPG
jgi:hypothetical protein